MANKTVLIVSNTSWSIFNFRGNLISELARKGYAVLAAAPHDNYSERIPGLGCKYIPVPMDNKGVNPLADLVLLGRFYRLLRTEKPLCVITYTIKPNIYAAFAAHALGIPVVTNVLGLGSALSTHGWVTCVARNLYRAALYGSYRVFFQNRDDLKHFSRLNIVRESISFLVPGSGVDTDKFSPAPEKLKCNELFRFLLFGRLLWEKGVGEFVEAARHLKQQFPHAEFVLMGFLGVKNRSAILREDVNRWVAEGTIRYIEASDNVVEQVADADCVVLPTYYGEGTPRALLEAASMGKPVITTDTAGCRDAVEQNVTGFLVKPRNANDLAEKMKRMLKLPDEQRCAMGRRAREKILREYDEKLVIERYLNTILEIETQIR